MSVRACVLGGEGVEGEGCVADDVNLSFAVLTTTHMWCVLTH